MDFNNIALDQAAVNVTWKGQNPTAQNGNLGDPVPVDSTEVQIRAWVTEALRTGGIKGIPADETANIEDFVLMRFDPTEDRSYNLISLRPKTPFGAR